MMIKMDKKIEFIRDNGDVAIGVYARRLKRGEILDLPEDIANHLLKYNKDFRLVEPKIKKKMEEIDGQKRKI